MANTKTTNAPPVDPHYRAPEALTDANAHTKASDVFMFGCIMWQVFTRTKAFYWLAPDHDLQVLLNERWKLKSEEKTTKSFDERLKTDVPVCIPTEATRLMLSCLHDQPGARPTMSQIKTELSNILSQESYLNPDEECGMVALPNRVQFNSKKMKKK